MKYFCCIIYLKLELSKIPKLSKFSTYLNMNLLKKGWRAFPGIIFPNLGLKQKNEGSEFIMRERDIVSYAYHILSIIVLLSILLELEGSS